MRGVRYILNIRFLLVILLQVLILPYILAKEKVADTSKDYILILNPDAETCAWSEMMVIPITKELQKRYPDLPVYVEYMYILGVNDVEGVRAFQDQLFAKYQNPPKYIMMVEGDTYGFMQDEIDKRWGDIPTLVLTRELFVTPLEYLIDRKAVPKEEQVPFEKITEERDNLYVVFNPFDIEGSVDIMVGMIPDLKKISFITDNRYISDQNRADLAEVINTKYPNIELENLAPDKLTTDVLLNVLRETPKNNGILYFTWFNNELTGEQDLYLQTNAYRIFSLYLDKPVFTINDVGLKESGMLGGNYTRFEQVFNTTMDKMDDIINGRSTSKEVYCPKPMPTFNYFAMEKYGIKKSDIPRNTYLYNRPLTFLEKNKDLILGLAIIIFLSIIFTRVILLIKTRQMQDKEIKLLAKYGDLVNNMPIGYEQQELIFSESGVPVDYTVTEVNPSFESQLTPSESVLGKKGNELNNEMLPEFLNMYKVILDGQSKKVSFSYYHKDSDRYFNVIMSPSSKKGSVDLFYTDTTELLKTQQLLRTINNKLSMSLDIANITPWKWDLQNKVILIDMNVPIDKYAEGLVGESQLSVGESEYFESIHEEDREKVRLAFTDLIEGKTAKLKKEYRLLRAGLNNEYEWVEAQAAVEKRDEQGNPTSLICSSLIITDRKHIEEELVSAKERAEELSRLKSAFLANMSHEIRTPLNAIVGFSSILASTDSEDERMEYINIIENNNSLLLQLISDILDLSKLEAGKMEEFYSDINLNSLMEEQIEPTREKAASNVNVIFEQGESDCVVHIEKSRMVQILTNLLTNAAKFTSEGEIRFGYRLAENNMIRIYVTDTGQGIAKDQLDTIFGRFIKLDSFKQGTGLGLSLCQTIVEYFGGEIGVDSEEGKGSTFWFTFPYSLPGINNNDKGESAVIRLKSKVLIAEDVPSNFELFDFILKRDFDVIHAWDGKEAIEMFKEHNPSIVLMDINMPKLNGYEATSEIRKISKDVPIIAVTAYAFSTDEKQIRKNGFDAYTPKPINAQKLKTQMYDLLRESSSCAAL